MLINYIVESKGWVQSKRVDYLCQYQKKYSFKVYTIRQFYWMWKLGMLSKQPVFFSSWRMVFGLLKQHPNLFNESHFSFFSAAVTSHSNIGGGLNPELTIPGRTPKEAYALATDLLKKFKVVSANSVGLYDLLRPEIPNILYCPNGVDVSLFVNHNKLFDAKCFRIGWVGKDRAAKNYSVIKQALQILEQDYHVKPKILLLQSGLKGNILSTSQMVDFYKNIDFYLCASWNEGTPNPALEAGSSGVPVVSTRVGNMPELIVDGCNGYFIEPTVKSIVDKFINLSNISNDKYQLMSESMKMTVRSDWSWEKKVIGFVNVFDKLVQK